VENIFKIGDHFLAGISLMYIKPANAYSLLVTFMLLHLSIDMLHYGFRIGFSIGNGEVFFKIHTGIRI
jgi:hypothetical protein